MSARLSPLAGMKPNQPLTRDIATALCAGAGKSYGKCGSYTPEELTNAMLACFGGGVARGVQAQIDAARDLPGASC